MYRYYGRIQDEGVSGFLVKKVEFKIELDVVLEDVWLLYDVLDKEEDNLGFGFFMGIVKWVSVYFVFIFE